MKKLSLPPICALCALAISAKGKKARARLWTIGTRSAVLAAKASRLWAFCNTPLLPIAAENVKRETSVGNKHIGHDRK